MTIENESPPLETVEPLRFESPYKGQQCERLHVFIGEDDVTFIRLLRPQMGTFTFTMAALWKALCDELRNRNILDHTSCESFESFVSNVKLITKEEYEQLTANRRPSPGSLANPDGRNVRNRPKTVRGVHSTKSSKQSNLQGDGGEGTKGGGDRGNNAGKTEEGRVE